MNKAGENVSLPELMDMDVNSAIEFCADRKTVSQKLGILKQLGLGYLTLGEETPSLSGGEAQRLKLASEIGRTQTDSVFVFDEPSIGLHPLDVRVLLGVFQALLDNGATVVVIEHDLDVIRNADFLIDMGPGGGEAGGRIVASGTPEEIQLNPDSITGHKWKVLILRDLMDGTKRFGELKKSIGHVTQKVLTAQLRDMEAKGLLTRKVYAEVPPRVEYTLTETGYSLKPILDSMVDWGTNYKQQNAAQEERHDS